MRVPDWPQILDAEVMAARERSFQWGVHDCIQFSARIVYAITGVDYRARFPAYDSKEGALRIIAEHGSLSGVISHVLGESRPAAFAGRGDVVVIDTPDGEAAGICLVNTCVFAAPLGGLSTRPRSAILRCWKI